MRLASQRMVLAVVIISLVHLSCSRGDRIDRGISKVKRSMVATEVLQILGKPDEAWGAAPPHIDTFLFVYKGKNIHTIIFTGGMVAEISGEFERRGTRFVRQMEVVIRGDGIVFRDMD